MTFFSKFVRTLSNTSDIFNGQNLVAVRGLLHGQILFNTFAPQPPYPVMHAGGTLTQAELQRVVADMVG